MPSTTPSPSALRAANLLRASSTQSVTEIAAIIDGEFENRLEPINEALRYILGQPNFACGSIARMLRESGLYEVQRKAEDEQAVTIHWMLMLYLKHGEKWREEGLKIIDNQIERSKVVVKET